MPPSSGKIRKENSKLAREVQVDILQYLGRSDQFVACEKLKTHCCGWQRCDYLLQEHAVQSGYSSLCVETARHQISLQFPCFMHVCVQGKQNHILFFNRFILLFMYVPVYMWVCACSCGCPKGPEEGVRLLGTAAIGTSKAAWCGWWEHNLNPPKE